MANKKPVLSLLLLCFSLTFTIIASVPILPVQHTLKDLKSDLSLLEKAILLRIEVLGSDFEDFIRWQEILQKELGRIQSLRKEIDSENKKIIERIMMVVIRQEDSQEEQATSERGGYWPRLAVRLDHFQNYMKTRWNEHWRPALDIALQMVGF